MRSKKKMRSEPKLSKQLYVIHIDRLLYKPLKHYEPLE